MASDQLLQEEPPSRSDHESLEVNNTMFIFGGRDSTGTGDIVDFHHLISIDMLTGERNQHTVTPSESESPDLSSLWACSASIGNTLYTYGGLIKWYPVTYSDELHKLNLDEMRWRRIDVKGIKPEKRMAAAMCKVKERLLLMGGYGPWPSQTNPNPNHSQAQYKKNKDDTVNCYNNELYQYDPSTGETADEIIFVVFCYLLWANKHLHRKYIYLVTVLVFL
jgi:hypothetical protein